MKTLSPDERSKLEAELAELENAYSQMISGQRVASVGSSGRSVSYGKGDQAALSARIAMIKRQLGRGPGRLSLRPYF